MVGGWATTSVPVTLRGASKDPLPQLITNASTNRPVVAGEAVTLMEQLPEALIALPLQVSEAIEKCVALLREVTQVGVADNVLSLLKVKTVGALV